MSDLMEDEDEPEEDLVGNTEPAKETEVEKGQEEGADQGDRAETPDGAEKEEYPGPS